MARVLVLGSFALLVVASQLLWLSFAAISPQAADSMGVSEGAIGDLAVINPAVFVLLAIPTGRWMDRRYGHALGAGAALTATGAVIRAIAPTTYATVAIGQVVMSLGQPLVLNASTKIAARYFPARQQTAAISVATASQFVGILIAVLTSGSLYDAGGLRLLLIVHATVSVVAAVAVLVSLRVRPRPVQDAGELGATDRRRLAWLRHDPLVWRMAALLFVGFGAYNALATWLDSIMTDFGHEGVAGNVIAAMTFAGILGAALLPGAIASRDARRAHCVVTTLVLAVVMVLLTLSNGVALMSVGLFVVGFFLLGTLPIVLDWSELHVGAARAGVTTGFLLLAGNLGAVFVVLTVQLAVGHPRLSLAVVAAWALPGLIIALGLPRHAGTHQRPTPTEG